MLQEASAMRQEFASFPRQSRYGEEKAVVPDAFKLHVESFATRCTRLGIPQRTQVQLLELPLSSYRLWIGQARSGKFADAAGRAPLMTETSAAPLVVLPRATSPAVRTASLLGVTITIGETRLVAAPGDTANLARVLRGMVSDKNDLAGMQIEGALAEVLQLAALLAEPR